MYALANQVPSSHTLGKNRTNTAHGASSVFSRTFVDRRENSNVQRSLIGSIQRSALHPDIGVVQRTKEEAMAGHEELICSSSSMVRGLTDCITEARWFLSHRSDPIPAILHVLGAYSFIITGATNIFQAYSLITQFVKAWNNDNETDPLKLPTEITEILHPGYGTEIEFGKVQRPEDESSWSTLAAAGNIDPKVGYVGRDNLESQNSSQLVDGIENFKKSGRENEKALPMFFTMDLVRENSPASPENNMFFIDQKLKSPYIKICNKQLVTKLQQGTFDIHKIRLSPGKINNTTEEVAYLMRKKRYVFVRPDLLLSPDLLTTGIDPRQLERMGLKSDEINSIMRVWEVASFASDQILSLPVVGTTPISVLKTGGMLPRASVPPFKITSDQTGEHVAILEDTIINWGTYDKPILGILPSQPLSLFSEMPVPKPPIEIEGMEILYFSIQVKPLKSFVQVLRPVKVFMYVPSVSITLLNKPIKVQNLRVVTSSSGRRRGKQGKG